MSLTNIVIQDGAVTPLNHTFVGVSDGPVARYVNEAAQTLPGQETLTYTVNRAAGAKGTQPARASVNLSLPKEVDNGDGTYAVSHSNNITTNCTFARKSSLQERLDAITLHIDALNELKADIANLRARF